MTTDSNLPQVYLAGPIQHVNDYGRGWRNWLKSNYPDEFQWLDPLDEYNTMEEAETEWTDEKIIQKDLDMIDASDAVLVHWDTVPTCGTPMEIFYAASEAVPVIVQTTLQDYDLSPWLTYHSDRVVKTFDRAINALHTETKTVRSI